MKIETPEFFFLLALKAARRLYEHCSGSSETCDPASVRVGPTRLMAPTCRVTADGAHN